MPVPPLRWIDPPDGPAIELLDQTRLPATEAVLTCRDVGSVVAAISRHGSSDWHTMGENVGDSGSSDPGALFRAYMASPKHRANILETQYRFVGIHTELRHGQWWNTLDFVDSYNGSYGATRATC